MRRFPSPALILFFLAPAVGELLSGSSPPAEFFTPFGIIVLGILYGGGAILARELMVRWGKGWPTLLVLGAAYGIVEEGLMVKSFFDPNWMDLGILGSYGRWAGVNWVWAEELTIYHAVFSIAIPVLLVTLMFPMRRSEAWISRQKFIVLAILFAANVAFGFLALTPFRPPVVPYLLALLLVLALIFVARRMSNPGADAENKRVARARWFVLTGFLATIAFFILSWAVPHTDLPPLLTMLLMAGLVVGVRWLVLKMSSGGAMTNSHLLALASGALGFFILFAPLQELARTRPDNTAGMTLVGLSALVFLVWLAWRVRRASLPDFPRR
jgi:hypothetical protein